MTNVATDTETSRFGHGVEEQVRKWVRPEQGRLVGHVYVNDDLFRMEIERIWKRLWLFAGHESEVPRSGDFLTRTVGTVPLIISRTPDDAIAVRLNTCRHRGNLVCNHESGNTSAFKCAYHGWTYRSDGSLLAVPYKAAYDDLDQSKYGLQAPARVSSYRGFIFVSYASDGPTIEEHLGNAREVLDRFMDASPTGRLRLDAGINRIRLDCNWKMYVENASDNYHATFTHISGLFTDLQRKIAAAISGDRSKAVVRALGQGHSELDFRDEQRAQGLVLRSGNAQGPAPEVEKEYVAAVVARIGEERATTILSDGPPTLYIFPNMFVIQQDIRRLEPVSATTCSLYQHPALLDGAPDDINRQRLIRHQAAYGPAGFFMSDDLEVLARTQRAVEGVPDEWILLSRGLHREESSDDGSRQSHVTDETAMRDMWRVYLDLMCPNGA